MTFVLLDNLLLAEKKEKFLNNSEILDRLSTTTCVKSSAILRACSNSALSMSLFGCWLLFILLIDPFKIHFYLIKSLLFVLQTNWLKCQTIKLPKYTKSRILNQVINYIIFQSLRKSLILSAEYYSDRAKSCFNEKRT